MSFLMLRRLFYQTCTQLDVLRCNVGTRTHSNVDPRKFSAYVIERISNSDGSKVMTVDGHNLMICFFDHEKDIILVAFKTTGMPGKKYLATLEFSVRDKDWLHKAGVAIRKKMRELASQEPSPKRRKTKAP